jgi:hypothetical protein
MQTLAVASRRGRTEVISFYRTDRRRGRQPSPFVPDTSPPPPHHPTTPLLIYFMYRGIFFIFLSSFH